MIKNTVKCMGILQIWSQDGSSLSQPDPFSLPYVDIQWQDGVGPCETTKGQVRRIVGKGTGSSSTRFKLTVEDSF